MDITFSQLETVLNQSANQRLGFFPRLTLDSRSAYRHWKRPFPSSPGPLYQNEVKYPAYDMEMIFYFVASKTHFLKEGFTLRLILKARVFLDWEVAF